MESPTKKPISIVKTYKSFMADISDEHIFYLQIVVALLLGLITLYVLSRRVIRSISGTSLLLVGGCESGKTALLYTLSNDDGTTPTTVTSFTENVSAINCGAKSVRVVDVPGHERVRNSAFDRHKNDARAILFLLDSATLQTKVRDVAEQLFTVLSDTTVRGSGCPIAVVCNKQDQELAKSASVIERALQREIDLLRETTSSRLASIETQDKGTVKDIGVAGQAFSFSDLTDNKVTFIESTVVDSTNIGDLKKWIDSVV